MPDILLACILWRKLVQQDACRTYSKYKVEDIEYVNSGVDLNRYRSNFEFGILGWDRYKITYDGECPAVAATLNILLGI